MEVPDKSPGLSGMAEKRIRRPGSFEETIRDLPGTPFYLKIERQLGCYGGPG